MSNFATYRRFSLAGFAFAAAMTLALNGGMLAGFDRMAHTAQPADASSTVTPLATKALTLPAIQLERVVITSRRA